MSNISGHSDSISLVSSRPSRQRQMPSRFWVESDESDNNDGTLCVVTLSDSNLTLSAHALREL